MWRGPGGRGRGVVVGEAAVLQRREVAVLIDVGPPSRHERREVAGHELHEGPAQRDGDQTDDHVGEAPDRDDAHGDPSDQEKSVPPTSYGAWPGVESLRDPPSALSSRRFRYRVTRIGRRGLIGAQGGTHEDRDSEGVAGRRKARGRDTEDRL